MAQVKAFTTDHKDLIHDVSYDFYGERMATSSSDHTVKIWDKDGDGGWTCSAVIKGHTGSVWRVQWAHPEFGNVVATCSFDRTAALWEELVGSQGAASKGWVRKHLFVDSRTSVSDIKFAPKHMGLVLATCSSIDGVVRIYEAPDVMNLSQWTLQIEIPVKLSCSSLSWCTSLLPQPIIAVGCDDSSSQGGKVFIYELSDGISSCNKIETIVSVTDPVQDVAFAPNLGRSSNLLAIASKDVTLIMLKNTGKDPGGGATFDQKLVVQKDDHRATVWRLCWNVTGTTLASTGDDGCIRLWKSNYLGDWKSCGSLKGDASQIEVGRKNSVNSHPNSQTNRFINTPMFRRSMSMPQ